MASAVRSRQRFWRDVPMAVMLLGWFGLAAVTIVYLVDWTPVWQQIAGGWQSQKSGQIDGSNDGSKAGDQAGSATDQKTLGDKIYTGSILIPERQNLCSQYGFDNRNGAMWTVGTVDCEKATLRYIAQEKSKGMGSERLLAIKRSLRSGSN